MIVTFCGHSKIADKDTVRKRLKDEIQDLLRAGYRKFYLGGYGDFDNLAAAGKRTEAVRHLSPEPLDGGKFLGYHRLCRSRLGRRRKDIGARCP